MTRHRVLLGTALLILLSLCLYAPALWEGYQDRRMQRMSLPSLEILVRQQPANAQARYRLGLAYAHENRFHDATNTLLAALDREPARPDIMNDLGVTYLLQERYFEALTALTGALTIRPDYPAAQANLGRLHLATQMPFSAVKELESAVKGAPSDLSTWCDLGEANQQTLNFRAAKRAYQKALKLDSHSLRATVGLGKVEFSLAEYPEAEKTLKQALSLSPDDGQALLSLARLHLEQATTDADLQAVRQLLDHAARVDPGNADIWYDQGRVALRRKEPTEAIHLLTRTLRMAPTHNAALHQLERALRAAGRTADADRAAKVFEERSLRDREETHLEEVIAHTPTDWDSQARLTEIYLQSGKRGLALLVFRRIQQGAPHHPALPKIQQALNRQFAASPSHSAATEAP